MKILGLQISNGYSPEAAVAARLFAERAGQYEVVTLHHDWAGDRESATVFEQVSRARVVRLDMGWRPNPTGQRPRREKLGSLVRFGRALPTMLRIARKYQPDLVYSNQQRWDCWAATRLARRLQVPQVVHLHYNIGPWLGQSVLRRLRTCDRVITVSEFIRRQALRYGVAAERVTTILNPMELIPLPLPSMREAVRAELGVPASASVIGMVARLDPSKGQEDAIAAFSQIGARYPMAHLVLVGDGMQRQRLEALAERSGFGPRIHFTGRRSDVPRLLGAFDIFIHPSRPEPFGLAIAEASAAGLPVVAYAEGGIPEIVAQGETGILVAPGAVVGLAAALAQLLACPTTAAALGRAGQRRVAERLDPRVLGQELAQSLGSTPLAFRLSPDAPAAIPQ